MNSPSPDIPTLVERLADADPAVRAEAARGLARAGGAATAALEAITLALDDPDGEVRMAAVQALGACDPVEAEPALLWATQSHDLRVQIAAHHLIEATAAERGPHSKVWRDPSISRSE